MNNRVRLPESPRRCTQQQCVYNEGGVCDDPRINRGNGDAVCHRVTPHRVISEFFVADALPVEPRK